MTLFTSGSKSPVVLSRSRLMKMNLANVLFFLTLTCVSCSELQLAVLGELEVSQITLDRTIYFPHFGNGGGLRSEIVFTNPSSSDNILGKIEFYNDQGERLTIGIDVLEINAATASIQTERSQNTSSVEFSISPLGSITFSTDGVSALTAGSCIVTSNGQLGGVIRFSISGTGIAGVGTSQSLNGFIIPVTRKKSGLNTGIALLNVGNSPVNVALSLNNQSGNQVPNGSAAISNLAPLGHVARFISELFPEAETEDFLGTVTATITGGEIAATAIELGTQEGEFTTLPVTPLENQAGSTMELSDGTFVCRPPGLGPFPAVLYNHGGLGTAVGGDLKGTCEALAEAGYLARSEKRRETIPLTGHLDDVFEGLSELIAHPDVDSSRVALLGYSRGGLLTLQAAVEKPSAIHAFVLMAPAPGGNNDMQTTLQNVDPITAPGLIMVAENDGPPATADDLLKLSKEVESALRTAGKEVTMIVYPPFASSGHDLFQEVRQPYWNNILAFLEPSLVP